MELGGTLVFCGGHVGLACSFFFFFFLFFYIYLIYFFLFFFQPHFFSFFIALFFSSLFLYCKVELTSLFFWMAFDMDGICSEAFTIL